VSKCLLSPRLPPPSGSIAGLVLFCRFNRPNGSSAQSARSHHGKFVAYYRVSTDKQGIDGYGISAQKKAVEDRLDGGGWELTASFTEVESGRHKSRPELEKALAACKKHKAKLIVARLTRNTQFLLTLLNSGTEVIFCDLPQIPGAMGRMIVTMMAAIAEFEAGLIGERTKAGLAVAKRQGKECGGTNAKSIETKAAAMQRAEALRPVLADMADLPLTAAAELNRRKIATPAGGEWHAQTVIRVRERLAAAEAAS
jgi:DNA invertase Pin-like site-specific DNA recombinase